MISSCDESWMNDVHVSGCVVKSYTSGEPSQTPTTEIYRYSTLSLASSTPHDEKAGCSENILPTELVSLYKQPFSDTVFVGKESEFMMIEPSMSHISEIYDDSEHAVISPSEEDISSDKSQHDEISEEQMKTEIMEAIHIMESMSMESFPLTDVNEQVLLLIVHSVAQELKKIDFTKCNETCFSEPITSTPVNKKTTTTSLF